MALVDEYEVMVKAGDDAADAVWCKVRLKLLDSSQEGGQVKNRYALYLTNQSRGLHTSAVVEEQIRTDGLIREQKFTVAEQGMTAADHGAIIVQALLILRKRTDDLVSPNFL